MNMTDEKIRFRGYLTFADSLKVQKAMETRRRVPASWWISAAALGATALFIYWMQVGVVFGAFLILFMAAFMYGGLRIMRSAAAKTQQRVYEKACTKRTGVLSAGGVTIRRNKALRSLPWDAFERAVDLGAVLAVTRGTETIGFAKYMFDTEMDWDRAKALILDRYGDSRADEN